MAVDGKFKITQNDINKTFDQLKTCEIIWPSDQICFSSLLKVSINWKNTISINWFLVKWPPVSCCLIYYSHPIISIWVNSKKNNGHILGETWRNQTKPSKKIKLHKVWMPDLMALWILSNCQFHFWQLFSSWSSSI